MGMPRTDRKGLEEPPTANIPAAPAADSATNADARTASENARTDDAAPPRELGGRGGPEPTRFGDWEKNGRCIDF
jgi:hypothetical protein